MSRSFAVLKRVRRYLPQKIKITLYYTLINPYFIYCNVLWWGSCKNALYKHKCLQKSALRIITGSPYCTPSAPLFARIRILHLEDMYRLQILLFMYSAKFKLLPYSCSNHVSLYSKTYGYSLWRIHDFNRPPFWCKVQERYIGIIGPILWNKLPRDVQIIQNIKNFKNRLTDGFLSMYIYI